MKRIVNVVSGIFAFITGTASITPQLSTDLGEIMDGVYGYVPQWGFGLVFIGLILFLWFINSPKEKAVTTDDKGLNSKVPSETYHVESGAVGKQEAKEIKNYFGSKKKDNDAPTNRNLAYQMNVSLSEFQDIMREVDRTSDEDKRIREFKKAGDIFYQVRDDFLIRGESLFKNSKDIGKAFMLMNDAYGEYSRNLSNYLRMKDNSRSQVEKYDNPEEFHNSSYMKERIEISVALGGELFVSLNERNEELRDLLKIHL